MRTGSQDPKSQLYLQHTVWSHTYYAINTLWFKLKKTAINMRAWPIMTKLHNTHDHKKKETEYCELRPVQIFLPYFRGNIRAVQMFCNLTKDEDQ